jgi:hypothetical protein
MALRTGEDYRQSIRDGWVVWIVSGLARPEMLMEIDVDAVIPEHEAGR